MKGEIAKLWREYKEVCVKKECEYFEYVIKTFGSLLYTPNKDNKPTFEGFMDYMETQAKLDENLVTNYSENDE